MRVTAIVKASFAMIHAGFAMPTQPAPILTDDDGDGVSELWPQLSFPQVSMICDAVALGREPVSAMAVRLVVWKRASKLDKTLHVFGARTSLESSPVPFLESALTWDKTPMGENGHNPLGVKAPRVPQMQNPNAPTVPGCFAPMPWDRPERGLVGKAQPPRVSPEPWTWPDGVMPEAFSAAPLDQRLPTLEGDEWVIIDGVHPELERFATRLPAPRAKASLRDETGRGEPFPLVLDSLSIDTRTRTLSLVWRGALPLLREHWTDFAVDGSLELGEPDDLSNGASASPLMTLGKGMRIGASSDVPHGASRTAPPPPPVAPSPSLLFSAEPMIVPGLAPPPMMAPSMTGPGSPPMMAPPMMAPPMMAPPMMAPPMMAPPMMASPMMTSSPALGAPPDEPSMLARHPTPLETVPPPAGDSNMVDAMPFSKRVGPSRISTAPPLAAPPVISALPPMPPPPVPSPAPVKPPPPMKVPPPFFDPTDVGNDVDDSTHDGGKAAVQTVSLEPATSLEATQENASALKFAKESVALESSMGTTAANLAASLRLVLPGRIAEGSPLRDLPLAGLDLSEMDLSSANFADANLAGAKLMRCKLVGAKLSHAKLVGADLTGANLEDADLAHADLSRAVLKGATLKGATLTDANLSAAEGIDSNFDGASGARLILSQGKWAQATFEKAELSGCDFSGAELTNARFGDANVVGSRFVDAKGKAVSFTRARMTDANLAGCQFPGGNFSNVDAQRTSWDRAQLSDASFREAILDGSGFARATIEQADFSAASLAKASLMGVQGDRSVFVDANLEAVDLRQGKLVQATFTGAKLVRCNALKSTLSQSSFNDADLTGTSLRSAKLRGASFEKTILKDADLRDADIDHADLRDADTTGARISGAAAKGGPGEG